MSNRKFFAENPTIEKEFIKRLKRGDTSIELVEYLKTTKYPGSLIPSTISAFVQSTYPKENIQLLLDVGFTENQLKKLNANKIAGLKDSVKNYKNILVPLLKKYDGTPESLSIKGVRGSSLQAQRLKFLKETNPTILKFLEKEVGKNFNAKKVQKQFNKFVSERQYDAARTAQTAESSIAKAIQNPRTVAANWIGDNSSKIKYGKNGGLELFIKDYEKKFGKIGSDPIFSGPERQDFKQVNRINTFTKEGTKDNIFSFKKGFSEDKLFKSALIQNNERVQNRLQKAFKLASDNRSYYADLGLRQLLQDLGKDKTNILGEFALDDTIRSGSTQEYSGVGGGLLRRSLLAIGITSSQLDDYKFIRKPLQTLEEIVNSLARGGADAKYRRNQFGLSLKDAKYVANNFQKIEAGRKSLNNWLKDSEKALGKNLFKNSLGSINFEHNIAKGLGAENRYLPRDYLLRGQYTPESFNLAKRDVFDKPLINLVKNYNATGQGAEEIQSLISRFNQSTNNYAGDLVFEDGRLKMLTEKVDVDRYIKNPNLSLKEYLGSSQLGKGLKEFAPESTSANLQKLISGGTQIQKTVSQELLDSVANLKPGSKAYKAICTIGKFEGGAVDECVERVAREPEKFANKFKNITAESGPLAKIKNASINFLQSPLLRGAGKYGAIAAVGAAGAGLVKTFMNDDPTTYLSNEDQQKNMLISMVTDPVVDEPKSDAAILDYQLPAIGAGAVAGTAATAPSTIKAARSRRFGKTPSGYTKTGLKTLGRGLTALGTPAGLLATEPLFIGGQIAQGDSLGEIATDPINYLGAAFADPATRFATKGLGPTASKIMRLGISPAALRIGSRFLGLPGLALSLGISGYEMYDDYKKKRGMFSEE